MRSNISYLLYFFIALNTCPVLAGRTGGFDVGNGGVVVQCEHHSSPVALDYLLTAELYGERSQIVTNISTLESLKKVSLRLQKIAPALHIHFENYLTQLYNESDMSEAYIWKAADSELPETYDQNIENLPTACQMPSPKIVFFKQAIRREIHYSKTNNAKTIVFYYDPQILKSLSSVQLSFLLVHEWLWDFSTDIRENRKINYYLHTKKFNSAAFEETKIFFSNRK